MWSLAILRHATKAILMFDKTDTTLSGFISQASLEDLSALTSQVFCRVNSLDQREQEHFFEQIRQDPESKGLLDMMQSQTNDL